MLIKLTCPASEFLLRQTPACAGIWDDCRFAVNDPVRRCDAWVVYDRLPGPQSATCDPGRIVFITGEPPSVHRYDAGFISQFGAVLTPRTDIVHPNVIRMQPAIPWWVGIKVQYPAKQSYHLDYDQLKAMQSFHKTKLLSVISTTKTMTQGHRQRLEFLRRLQSHFGNRLDVFGHGFEPIEDKWDAIAPYRYHIVLENSSWPDYWTEKLADTFLAGALPLYWGCPNLADYFPTGSLKLIDRDDPDKAIAAIENAIGQNEYESSTAKIMDARELVLDRYNLFAVLADAVHMLPAGAHRRIRLLPEEDFVDPPVRRLKRKVKRLLRR
jgi:hypothetical protein